MDLVLLSSLVISVFALGGSQFLIMRYRVSRYGLLAALTAFLSAVIVIYQLSHLLPGTLGWSVSIFGQQGEFPGLAVSVMALIAVFFLERLLTLRRRASEEVSSAMERATLAERAKVEFLANMSHELRTPLNAIMGFSEAMRLELLGPLGQGQYRDYAKHINDSGTKLCSLINDILDMSRMEAGEFELAEQEVDVLATVNGALQMTRERAETAGIELLSACSANPTTIRADGRALTQILLNLLSNAVKFTPKGGSVAVHTGLADDGCFFLRVSDTGMGIAQRDLHKTLTNFGQVDGTLSRKYEGAGLGLPLCRRLAELHGGELRIESNVGAGTTVTVSLPAKRVRSVLTKGEGRGPDVEPPASDQAETKIQSSPRSKVAHG